MKYLVVGLGNKGEEYKETRHNIGFKIAEKVANSLDVKFQDKNFGKIAEGKYKGRKIFILKPDTYMNLSGNAVEYWLKKESISVENLLIITDDLALNFGTLRMKPKGSNGGHNGLRNIENILETSIYPRLRFGISANFNTGRQVDYVLSKWSDEEIELLDERIEIFSKAVLSFVFSGLQNTMNNFNGK